MRQAVAREGNGQALKRALAITAVFTIIEFVGGLWTNSLALMADSGHMLTDVAALALSLFAVWFAQRPATPQQTYGYFRVEILAALVNGASLIAIAVFVFYESYRRFLSPETIKTKEMLLIGSAGLVANLATASILRDNHQDSLNVRAAFLHVLGDVLGSVAVILAGGAMWLWGALWADPLVSALVSLLILISAWKLVRDSVLILLEGTPAHVNLEAMREELSAIPGVESVHDLHVWTLTSGFYVMTCHAVVSGDGSRDEILTRLGCVSRDRFGVHHTTIQIEDTHLCKGNHHACC
jgi:cobalt-zinc-cadmium efflux system protein